MWCRDRLLSSSSVFTSGDHNCVCVGRGGVGGCVWGVTIRKSLTTNCPRRDQHSHKNQTCLHKRLLPVFTARTHFCFTQSELGLFCFTSTVSVRATLTDESSQDWQTGGSSPRDTVEIESYSIELNGHGLSTSSLITCVVFLSKQSGCLGRHLREEERARHRIGLIPISPTNKTGRKRLRGWGVDYTLHAGERVFSLREDEAQKEKRKYKPGRRERLEGWGKKAGGRGVG